MTTLIRASQLHVSVLFTSEEVAADVRDRRLDTVTLFGELDEAQREQLVHDAWSIGLRALQNAHSAAQESKLKDVGASLLADVDRQLREELKGADEDRQRQLSAALVALDANDESSLLSRLVRETHEARRDVLAAVNPDAPASPMAVLKTSLTKLLQEQAEKQGDHAKRQDERQTQFEKEVREALARIETKRTLELKTTRGGLDFEDAVTSFVRAATQGGPCIFDVTGATAGVGRCKKGDAVLRFTSESAFAGAAVVFEAKRDATYTVQKALDELDVARKNRDAGAGVFVMAGSHASDVFPRFARYGNNVIVTWDDQDPASDAHLHAAVLLGMALVTRTRTAGDAGDIAALRDIEARIEAELSRLVKMEKHSDTIRRNADGISDEVRKAQKALDLLLRKAQSTLQALNVEVQDEAAERSSPIALAAGSLGDAVSALPHGGGGAGLCALSFTYARCVDFCGNGEQQCPTGMVCVTDLRVSTNPNDYRTAAGCVFRNDPV